MVSMVAEDIPTLPGEQVEIGQSLQISPDDICIGGGVINNLQTVTCQLREPGILDGSSEMNHPKLRGVCPHLNQIVGNSRLAGLRVDLQAAPDRHGVEVIADGDA